MISLEFPTMERKQDALDYIEEFRLFNSEINGTGGLDRYEDYSKWIKRTEDHHVGLNVEEDRVPASTYFCVDNQGLIVGMVNIRHKLNDFIINHGYGHIGYSVRPTERKKGYATEILRLSLEKCRELDMSIVHVGCYKDNIGSKKTILKNKGVLYKEFEEEGKIHLEYKIYL